MTSHAEPTLFLWSFSAWASKINAYFALRKIPHSRCEQPITLPRPDITALGVKYRRIPILAIGRDVFCDTLAIIDKLEKLYPASAEHKSISATNNTDLALERMLEKWTDVVVFKAAAAAIPTDMELMKDPAFQKDREALWGRKWSKEEQDALRPAGIANLRANFDFLEMILGDGRQWILGSTDGPMLADIHACWIFDWLFQIPGSLPDEIFGEGRYPLTNAWRDRYNATIAKAKENAPQPKELDGKTAISQILSSDFLDKSLAVEEDPIGLKEGQEVEAWPVDTGYSHRDSGKLLGLNTTEIIMGAKSENGTDVRLHYPRWNFEIAAAGKAVNGR